MSKLYIMCGLPFSGKTTLAKKIANYTNSELIGFDSMWKKLELKIDPKMEKEDEWKFIIKKAHEKIRESLGNNFSVVYDDINVRYEHREVLRTITEECNATSKVIFVDTPIATIKEREKINKSTKERHDVIPENFEKALSQFQKPTYNERSELIEDIDSFIYLRYKENIIRFTPSDDLEKWLTQQGF